MKIIFIGLAVVIFIGCFCKWFKDALRREADREMVIRHMTRRKK